MYIGGSPSQPKRKRLLPITAEANRELCLRRLRRVATLEREYSHQLNAQGLAMLRTCTFILYCECLAIGLNEEARNIMRDVSIPSTKER
jgi:hypothetical protein